MDVHLAWHVIAHAGGREQSQAAAAVQAGGFPEMDRAKGRGGSSDCHLLRSGAVWLRPAPATDGAGSDELRHPAAQLGRPAHAGEDRPHRRAGDVECAGPVLCREPKALALVRVPTEEQERQRTQTRMRQSLVRDLEDDRRAGRGLALQYGYQFKGNWYGGANWPKLELPAWLIELLNPLRAARWSLHDQVRSRRTQIEAASARPRPKGMGGLSEQLIDREVGDWTASRTGGRCRVIWACVPSENSSGPRHQQGT